LTGDLDIVLQLSRDNVLGALSALASLGYKPRGPVPVEQFADPVVRQSWIDDKGMADLDGTVVSVIGRADLIEMKRKVARPKDMEDVAALERIARIEAES